MGRLRNGFTMVTNMSGIQDYACNYLLCRLYDFHPDGQEDLLIDTMKMLKYTGDPWEDVFSPKVSSELEWSTAYCILDVQHITSISPLLQLKTSIIHSRC